MPFELTTGASNYSTGAVLYQRKSSILLNKQPNIMGHYSYIFDKTQGHYPTTKKKAIAVVMALH